LKKGDGDLATPAEMKPNSFSMRVIPSGFTLAMMAGKTPNKSLPLLF
jgi:hypothetical protein